MTDNPAPMSALPEDDGKRIAELTEKLNRYATDLRYDILGVVRAACADAAITLKTLSREIERQTAAADYWNGFARRLAEENARLRAETLEEAAKVADKYRVWTAYDTGAAIRSLITDSAAGQETGDE